MSYEPTEFDEISEETNFYDNDADYEINEAIDFYGNDAWNECEFDEGSDRDNWEDEQVFQDGHDY